MKNGTPTGFQDRNGQDIKTADRIKHTGDGSILTINKFGKAVSVLGFQYDLQNLAVSRGMNPDGTYFAHLTEYDLTDEVPAKPEGETVKPGDDVENMAPPRVKDPRNEKLLKKEKTKKLKPADPKVVRRLLADPEREAVDNGLTVEDARRLITLQDFQDEDLADELRDRGYTGEITKTKTIKI